MKKIFLTVLTVLLVVLSSCKKEIERDDIEIFYNIPALLGYDFELKHTTLITPSGTYLAPQLTNLFINPLEDGDPFLTVYAINNDQEKFEGYTVLYELYDINILRKESSQATEGGESAEEDFKAPIQDMAPYTFIKDSHFNHNVAFFYFIHANNVSVSARFIYEMTYDPDEDSEIPTVYFRAKQVDAGIPPYEPFVYFCTFELDEFLLERGKINIMYKTGEENEKELFKEWEDNPLSLS